MKLEIEITEDEIRSAIQRKVRTSIADQTNTFATDLAAEMERKLRTQLASVLKNVNK